MSTIQSSLSATPSTDEIFHHLKVKLGTTVPEMVLYEKAVIAEEIHRLKRERNAVILAHNYMASTLYHAVPDFTGDSLELSRYATTVEADIIVLCGVEFMAETAKILNPEKTVLLPSRAGCSLASSITAKDVRMLKERYPGVPVVTYINTYADVKAETDICCTSGNAVKVVESLDTDTIIFLPDEYLASNIAKETGKHIIVPTAMTASQLDTTSVQNTFIGWNGRCEVHDQFSVEDIENVRKDYPDVVVLAHPECKPEVVAASDMSGSTAAMIKYVQSTTAKRILLLTECSMGENIASSNPATDVLRLCSVRCPHMAEISLENVLWSLKEMKHIVEIPEDIRVRAYQSVKRMLDIG